MTHVQVFKGPCKAILNGPGLKNTFIHNCPTHVFFPFQLLSRFYIAILFLYKREYINISATNILKHPRNVLVV